jgi:hypothetical protein
LEELEVLEEGGSESRADLHSTRFRLAEASLERQRGSRVRVSVTLDLDDDSYVGEAEGVGLEVIELRLAAEATLAAISNATGAESFRLLGIKRLHAFDADVVLVVLRDRPAGVQRYVGAVPVRTTYIDGAVAAVLNALNRALGQHGEGQAD